VGAVRTRALKRVVQNLHLSTMLPIVWAVALYSTLIVSGYEWPSPQYDALETFLYEGRDLATSDISSIVGNCKVRGSPDSMVAAEWLRFVSRTGYSPFSYVLTCRQGLS
jgi:hypothetical protein